MIHVVRGDLLESDCNVIAHQCNCFGNWDCGLAEKIRTRYPSAYRADQNLKSLPQERLGQLSVGVTSNRQMMIFNLYGQYRCGPKGTQYTDYQMLQSAVQKMMDWVLRIARNRKDIAELKIGLPYHLGCGRGGGDWSIVRSILEQASEQYQREIYLYSINDL